MFEQLRDRLMADAWVYSAFMNAILALVSLGFSVGLTKGAGFQCRAAVVRLAQRIAFLYLAGAMLNCALHILQTHRGPSLEAFLVQIGFMAVLATSAIRHTWAPPIPHDATWRRPMHTTAYTGLKTRKG